MKQVIKRAASAIGYFTEDTARFYFAKTREYESAGIIAQEPPKSTNELPRRLDVVDLVSLPDNNTRYLITNSVLAEEWERARQNWENAFLTDVDNLN